MKLTPRRIEPVQKDWSGRTELACEVLCGQFLPHFMASFVPIVFHQKLQSQTVIREKLKKRHT